MNESAEETRFLSFLADTFHLADSTTSGASGATTQRDRLRIVIPAYLCRGE